MGARLSFRGRALNALPFWPRRTLGRTLVLLGLVLLGTQGAVYVLFRQNVLDPAAKRFAEFLWQTDRALAAEGGAHIRATKIQWRPANTHPGTTVNNHFLRATSAYLARLSPGATLRVGAGRDDHPIPIWIRGGAGQPWFGMRISPVTFGGRNFLFMRLGVIAIVALLGAWLIVRQINRPLARLAAEAPRIGLGDTVDSLNSIGDPLEVQHLKEAITGMANDLHRLHEERTLLLTGISHELRTPLSRLLLTLHLPDKELLTEKVAMLADVSEMDETIDKFLTLVCGSEHEKMVATNFRVWIRTMAETARERYRLQVDLDSSGQQGERILYCRPLALERVFRILFDNIRRYGGGRMDMGVTDDADYTEVRLRDYGLGVSAATLAAMNEGTLPRQTGHGSGIGLRICHRIMALHGGHLHFRKGGAGGLIAILRFPVSAPEQFL